MELSRRKFIATTASMATGWLVGLRPILPVEYVLSASVDEEAMMQALTIEPDNPSYEIDRDNKRIAARLILSIDRTAMWQAVKVTDQHGHIWTVEGEGDALISPDGERFGLGDDEA